MMKMMVSVGLLMLSALVSAYPKTSMDADVWCSVGQTMVERESRLVQVAVSKQWNVEEFARESARMLYGDYPDRDDQEDVMRFVWQHRDWNGEVLGLMYRVSCQAYWDKALGVERV